MKDTHNVILILVSSSKFNSLFRRFIKILDLNYSSFFSRSSKLSQFSRHEDPSNHCKSSPCVFNFSFLSFDHSFITRVLHGGSKCWFIKDVIPSRGVYRDSFQRCSSILHLAFRSAILSTLSLVLVLCHSWQFSFMLHDWQVVRNEIFKPIIFFLGVILGYISPKAFHWECCYFWCLSMIQVFSYPLGERSFHLFVISSKHCFR